MSDRPTREHVDAALATLRDEVECCGTENCVYCGAVTTLLEELGRERGASKPELRKQIQELEATIARVEELCGMNHKDSLIRVSDIRAALRGAP